VTTNSFAGLGLAEPLLRALDGENYTEPTEIQRRAIPELLQGRDLLGIAQTGTGKTAAFALPIIQLVAGDRDPSLNRKKAHGKVPSVLVLLPTRELAVQVAGRFAAYGRHYGLRCGVIVGGVSAHSQRRTLKIGVDVIVATPGRMLDHIQNRDVRLDQVTHLVLDEADRMLDMGFIRDVRKIIAALPKTRQNLLFSATMPPDVETLARDILHDPLKIEIAPEMPSAERIEQFLVRVPRERKRSALLELLAKPDWTRVIVFTRTKHGANRVAKQLSDAGVEADSIHGNKAQNARQAALKRFSSGGVRVLVATDIAARGIDVRDISHVVNFELPNEPETYVHRIGRTARAGAEGIAVSLCDSSENQHLKKIERLTGVRMTPLAIDGIADAPKSGDWSPVADDEPAEERRSGRTDGRGKRQRPQEARNGERREKPRHGASEERREKPRSRRPDGEKPAREAAERPARDDFKRRETREGYDRREAREETDRREPRGDFKRREPREGFERLESRGEGQPRGDRRNDRPREDRPRNDRPRADRSEGRDHAKPQRASDRDTRRERDDRTARAPREDRGDKRPFKAPRPANDDRSDRPQRAKHDRPRNEAADGNAPRKRGGGSESGHVKWFNVEKGYGFIVPDNGGGDVFVHASALESAGIREPKEGLRVGYRLERKGRDGKMSASNLRVA
jgi:ATP-dependent RNA helicase RhlE